MEPAKVDQVYKGNRKSKLVEIVALAGRHGSGKSTALQELAARLNRDNQEPLFEEIFSGSVIEFCCLLLWNDTSRNTKQVLVDLLMSHFRNFTQGEEALFKPYQVKYDLPPVNLKARFHELSFSQSLKRITAQLFQIPYPILAGETPESRVIRENDRIFFAGGARTLREILEFLGTEVFRAHDPDIWIKSCYHRIQALTRLSFSPDDTKLYFGLADLRFENEFDFLNTISAKCFCVYRKASDLILTEADQETHISRWAFLKFYDSLRPLENTSSAADLGIRLAYHLGLAELPWGLTLVRETGWIGVYQTKIVCHEFTLAKVKEFETSLGPKRDLFAILAIKPKK